MGWCLVSTREKKKKKTTLPNKWEREESDVPTETKPGGKMKEQEKKRNIDSIGGDG